METASGIEIFWSIVNAIGFGYGLKIWRQAVSDANDILATKNPRQTEVFQAKHNRRLTGALTWVLAVFLAVGVILLFVPRGNETVGTLAIFGLMAGDILLVYSVHIIDYGRRELRKMVRAKRKEDDSE